MVVASLRPLATANGTQLHVTTVPFVRNYNGRKLLLNTRLGGGAWNIIRGTNGKSGCSCEICLKGSGSKMETLGAHARSV